jgi:hypothetical protein
MYKSEEFENGKKPLPMQMTGPLQNKYQINPTQL